MEHEVEVQGGEIELVWNTQTEEETMRIVLTKQGALCRSYWFVGVNRTVAQLR